MRIYPCFIPHLACPNRCVFCDQEKITGKKEPDPAGMLGQFARDLENISDKGVELAFYGGNFTAIDPAIQEKILAGVRTLDKKQQGAVHSGFHQTGCYKQRGARPSLPF